MSAYFSPTVTYDRILELILFKVSYKTHTSVNASVYQADCSLSFAALLDYLIFLTAFQCLYHLESIYTWGKNGLVTVFP